MAVGAGNVKAGLSDAASVATISAMNDPKPSREQRLAAKLRENLHRRKAQARAAGSGAAPGESPDLPKPPPTR